MRRAPVVVNPDATLRRIARERGWEVVRLDRLGRRLWWGRAGGAAAAGRGRVTLGRRVGGGGPRGHARPPEPLAPCLAATDRKIRVVVAKPGLDGHDRGAKIIARALRDAGMEVIYTGLHQTPEQIVETVIQEDADAVGLSILSGAHMTLVPRIMELLHEQGIDDVVVTVGGTIPAEDIAELKRLGVAEVFTPGRVRRSQAIDFIRGAVRARAPRCDDPGLSRGVRRLDGCRRPIDSSVNR